jgi:nucleotide-binding universal stress UspA family protein
MKILLALDTSAGSQAALDEAAQRPWPPNSSFEVVSVAEPSHLWTTSEVVEQATQRAQEVVDRALERLASAGQQASGSVPSGDPKTVILDRAQTSQADLLMLGSHGASEVEGILLGNVAAAVMRYAPCSVEVVRASTKSSGGRKVLLATDGSPSSVEAANAIASRPWPAGSEFRVLSIVELVLTPLRALFEVPALDPAYLDSAREEAMKHAQSAVDSARQILEGAGLATSESISVLIDSPKTIIVREAADWGADLIVLGSHGRRGMTRFLMGSVSEAVATGAGCSVEVVRTPPQTRK